MLAKSIVSCHALIKCIQIKTNLTGCNLSAFHTRATRRIWDFVSYQRSNLKTSTRQVSQRCSLLTKWRDPCISFGRWHSAALGCHYQGLETDTRGPYPSGHAVAFSPDGKALTRKDRLQLPQQTTLIVRKSLIKKADTGFHFSMMPHGHFSKVEKTQDFVLHGDQLRQMSASFTEWSKRFELVTCEDGCRVSLISGDEDISANNNTPEAQNSPISDQVNPPVHGLDCLDSKVPTTGIGIVERLRPGILSPINWKLSAVAKPVFPAPFFSSSVICDRTNPRAEFPSD